MGDASEGSHSFNKSWSVNGRIYLAFGTEGSEGGADDSSEWVETSGGVVRGTDS